MWHELKEYLRKEIKRRTKDELISGIEEFCDRSKCQKYIRHLRKVLPRAVELNGDATDINNYYYYYYYYIIIIIIIISYHYYFIIKHYK